MQPKGHGSIEKFSASGVNVASFQSNNNEKRIGTAASNTVKPSLRERRVVGKYPTKLMSNPMSEKDHSFVN